MEREMEEEAEQEEKEEEEMASEDDVEEEKEEEEEKQEDAKIKEEEEKQEEEKENEEEEQPTRKRSSEAIDTTGDASVEPPTKQIRASDTTEVDPDLDPDLAPIQPGPPKQPPFDRSALDARCVLRQHFYHVVHQLLPSMVARLMNVWQRSEAGELPRFGLIPGLHGRMEHFIRMTLADVDMVALSQHLVALRRAARVLHHHLVTTGPVDDAAQTDLNALRLERVNSRANRLAEQLQMATYHDPPHPAEQMTKLLQCVDEIRLIVYQGVFRDLRLREPPLDRQENDPCHLPIRDAWELVKLVCNELSRAIDAADDLSDWLSTYPAAVSGPVDGDVLHPTPIDDEQTIRMDALALVHQLMRFCFEKLTEQLQFLHRRAQLARHASLQPPECFERMEALNRQDSSTRTLWRIYARRLAAHGEQLLLYVHNKIRVLEK